MTDHPDTAEGRGSDRSPSDVRRPAGAPARAAGDAAREAIDDFIERARDVPIAEAAKRLGMAFKRRGSEHPQPCPACGGKDRFSFNTDKNLWNCRGSAGGADAIGMAAHVMELDLNRRDGFLEACAAVLGEQIPEGATGESEEDRAARQQRIAERQRQAEADAAERRKKQIDFRERERGKARGIYLHAVPIDRPPRGPHVRAYLARRGAGVPVDGWLRWAAELTYWHGEDELGRPAALYSGPAMVAPFIVPASSSPHGGEDGKARRGPKGAEATAAPGEGYPLTKDRQPLAGAPGAVLYSPPRGEDGAEIAPGWFIVGCHITWIDLARSPKFRPLLADPVTGELLPTKKMRGTKKGGLIPLAGNPFARRWAGGEGIENVLAIARAERFRTDTFYFAAGDLGNLAGPADPASAFPHPTLTKIDAKGRERPVMVQGPVPKPDSDGDAIPVPGHVTELLLVGDGDSERVATASAMARAKRRYHRPGRLIPLIWPRAGSDFAQLMAEEETAEGREPDRASGTFARPAGAPAAAGGDAAREAE